MTTMRRAKGPSDLVTAARRAGVRDARVPAALAAVPRAAYVPARGVGRAGGRLVQPVGPGGNEEVVLDVRRPDGLGPKGFVTGARFVPLVGRHAFRDGSEAGRDE